MDDSWVVFARNDDDRTMLLAPSEVLGIAHSIEGVLTVIDSVVFMRPKTLRIEFPYSDVMIVRAEARGRYSDAAAMPEERAWRVEKRPTFP